VRGIATSNLPALTDKLDNLLNIVDEIDDHIKLSLDGSDFSENDLERLDDRIHQIRDIARKHRITTDEITSFTASLEEKINKVSLTQSNLNANLKLLLQSLFLLSYFFYNQDVVISNFYFSSLKKDLYLNSFSIIFSIFCFLLFINSINMFDGINLQVGFYSLFIFLLLFFKVDNQFIIPIIIALIFFLVLNFNNNSFLGNSGSYLLGFIISYFFSISSNIFSAEQIFLIMLIPGLDMLRVAVFRIINKKHPFSSDKNHIHYLMLSKFKFYQTFIIIQLLIILPVVMDIFFKNKFTIFFIIISIIIYSSIIYLLTSKKLNK
jgi:UDP-GlcNAc:undecaprenyl-phosphate GlcNAc-1-phosphate transferase